MADVKMIIVEHLIHMHKELYSELKRTNKHNDIVKDENHINQYDLIKQFEHLTKTLHSIALSFSPKDEHILNVN